VFCPERGKENLIPVGLDNAWGRSIKRRARDLRALNGRGVARKGCAGGAKGYQAVERGP